MNNCIDIRCLNSGNISGVEIYTQNLIKSLLKHQRFLYLFNASWKKIKLDFLSEEEKLKVKSLNIKVPSKIFNPFLKLFGKIFPIDFIIKKKFKVSLDEYIVPNLALITPISKTTKKITVVHDLSFVIFSEFFSFRHKVWHWFVNPRREVKNADFVWADSYSTKSDLIDFYNTKPSKIKIVYPVLEEKTKFDDINYKKEIKKNLNKYILYLGTIEPRKNLKTLIKAFEYLKKEKNFSKYKLVLAGSKGWKYKPVLNIIERSIYKKDILFIGKVSEVKKNILYKNATCFVYPSFYEGYGLPPLEAIRKNCPVVCGYNSSLSEVVKNQTVMVDITKEGEILEGIKIAIEYNEIKKK